MEMPNRDEITLKTFNTAKKFAEDILFPLMHDYKRFQRQANFGSENLNEAAEMTEEIRDIQRFNGLKAMVETCQSLLLAISSTVYSKRNKLEIIELEKLIALTDRLKVLFYDNKNLFFITTFNNTKHIEMIEREYFEKIKRVIDVCYINAEVLMTKNKILFADSGDEYLSDDEIKELIKNEYVNN
jgi:hypothetical protein